MLAVATHWRWFGLPGGMYDAVESKHGIHAGDIETSLMLSFRRDLVAMDKAKNFVSSAIAMEKEFKHLGPTGTHAFGWIAQDLNAEGAVGDAGKATAEKGDKTAAHQIDGSAPACFAQIALRFACGDVVCCIERGEVFSDDFFRGVTFNFLRACIPSDYIAVGV